MNWGALALVAVGGAAVVIGFKGSAGNVCKTVTGKDCPSLFPTPKSTGTTTVTNDPLCIDHNPDGSCKEFPTNTKTGPLALDKVVSDCFKSPQCKPWWSLSQVDAQKWGIDQVDFLRQIGMESGFNPNAKSPAGAEGIAQFMPSTAASLGVNPWDPKASLDKAAALMNAYIQRYGGDPVVDEPYALAAYNAGPGATDAAIAKAKKSGQPFETYLPAETVNYIDSILSHEG